MVLRESSFRVLELLQNNVKVRGQLQDLMLRNVVEGEKLSDQGAREYLGRGAGDGSTSSTSPSKIYDLFEPSRRNPLPKATLNELRRTSLDVKLRQLSALMASRGLFGVDPDRENGVQLVRDRWACLRQALRG